MKVKLKTILAGPDGCKQPGAILEVDEKIGQHMLDNGYADMAEEPKEKDVKKAPVIEVAVAKPKMETAVSIQIPEIEE